MLKYAGYDIVFQEIPDEVTLAISLTNCPNRCPGCHSPQLRDDTGEPLTEEVLEALLEKYRGAVTCVCLMGGDGDPADIKRIARFLHTQRTTPVKVGWYSGRSELPKASPPRASNTSSSVRTSKSSEACAHRRQTNGFTKWIPAEACGTSPTASEDNDPSPLYNPAAKNRNI